MWLKLVNVTKYETYHNVEMYFLWSVQFIHNCIAVWVMHESDLHSKDIDCCGITTAVHFHPCCNPTIVHSTHSIITNISHMTAVFPRLLQHRCVPITMQVSDVNSVSVVVFSNPWWRPLSTWHRTLSAATTSMSWCQLVSLELVFRVAKILPALVTFSPCSGQLS